MLSSVIDVLVRDTASLIVMLQRMSVDIHCHRRPDMDKACIPPTHVAFNESDQKRLLLWSADDIVIQNFDQCVTFNERRLLWDAIQRFNRVTRLNTVQ